MPYSICGLIFPQSEEPSCFDHKWPFVTLAGGVSLIPLNRRHILLTEGDETRPAANFDFAIPDWLSNMASAFTKCAYIEAEIWGGDGMQASVTLSKDQTNPDPVISSGAINYALLYMGINHQATSMSSFGLSIPVGKDPFDTVGLGRHRSVSAWLKESFHPD